ncbi:MAG: hypothetical protein ACTHK2_05630 [Dokdonella sp.]|uniref:hypothetical protein n=1 Tax=Dokdonella sp. TaxID=2291710 RepID=UPI003F81BA26
MRIRSSLHVSMLAFAAISAGSAGAVALNPRGLGQALIYPYYTVNIGQDTLVSVANAGDAAKVVKVRFREGYNHRVVLDFNLFLSPRDAWTGAISADAAGGARLVSVDHSCTLPALPSAGIAFSSSGYAGASTDGGPTTIARTREGSIEMIALGDVVRGSETELRITHVGHGQPHDGVPPGCAELTATNIATDLEVPGDDLFGAAGVINVGIGTYYPYNADALAGFTAHVLYTPLATLEPDLRSANSDEATHGVARAYVSTGKGVLMLDYARGEDAVSAVYMAQTLRNEFLDAAGLGAATDWVVTFPTKQYYVDGALGPAAQGLFEEAFAAPGRSDVQVRADFFDQEEGAFSTSPPPDGCGFICVGGMPLSLSYAVNVMRILPQHTIVQPSEVFGSTLSTVLLPYGFPAGEDLPPIDAGWVDLDLANGGGSHALAGGRREDGSVVELSGLPVTGFMAYNVINANAQPGKLANYSGVFAHRSTVGCSTAGIHACP